MSFLKQCLLGMLLLCLFCAMAQAGRTPTGERIVRVGIFPMPPLNYVDEDGTAQGLFSDLLREIAHQNGWSLVFVPGSWGECYDRLLAGEIDLLTTVAYSEERDRIFDYNSEPVADIWGQVYTRPDTGIIAMQDLAGRLVAIARKDINGKNFRKTAAKLGVQPVIVEVENHHDIFAAIRDGTAVAGVVPQHFGFRQAEQYGLVPTTIEFEPFSVYFASREGANAQLLKKIDSSLENWKREHDSVYFERVNYWMGNEQTTRFFVPGWVKIAFLVVVGGALLLMVISVSLKHQVNVRTREIAHREERFRKLSETTKAVPWEMDLESGRFAYIGPRIVDIFGYPIDAWQDLNSWLDKVHPEDRAWAARFCTSETAKGADHDFVYRALHKDGRVLWVHDIVSVVKNETGPPKLYGFFLDITEQREHQERFQRMFREHNATMLLIDPDTGRIVDANHAACDFYGYSREAMLSMTIMEINVKTQQDVLNLMCEAMNKQRNYFEHKHRLANGDVRDIESYAYPIEMGGQTLLFAIIHDISERKKLLEEHGRAAQLAALGTVAAGVAHEINNPIQGIVNYAALLRSAPEKKERVLELAERIIREGDRIAAITRNLLNYARDNRDEKVMSDLGDLVESSLALLAAKSKNSGVTVDVAVDRDLPRISVNPQSIQQVVINLVDNAYDALAEKENDTEEKCITIRGYRTERDRIPYLCLEVDDNGIGMSTETLARAKDAFFSTKPSSKGTGLGLSIVNEIVSKHSGHMLIESREGMQTRIRILFPLE